MDMITIKTTHREELIDITQELALSIRESAIKNGVVTLFVLHTTCGLTINENADPDVKDDLLLGLQDIVNSKLPYKHAEGNSPAHLKSSLLGPSLQVLIHQGKLQLGTWQGIYLVEFDGPRTRKIIMGIVEV